MEPVTQASALIASPIGVMACLAGIAAFFFWLARVTGWTLFKYLIPLIWIYAVPMVLSSTGVLPSSSPAYDLLGDYGLPVVIVLLLLAVDLKAAVRVMGRGIGVMLLGTLGVVVGAPVGYLVVHRWLAPEAWTGFGALSGSWIGGTGNLFAAAEALGAPAEMAGLAVLADSLIYIVWLPVLWPPRASPTASTAGRGCRPSGWPGSRRSTPTPPGPASRRPSATCCTSGRSGWAAPGWRRRWRRRSPS
jgi:uncharacterized membrane protein